MIKKLQRKFILIATAVIFTVVLIIMLAINVANFVNINKDADIKIDFIIKNQGRLPNNNQGDIRPNDGNTHLPNGFSPEMPYETRCFSVLVAESGEMLVNVENIAAVNTQTAESYVRSLLYSGKTEGFFNNYKFRAVQQQNGTLFVFLDCSRDLNTFRNFLWTSIAISTASVVLVFVLILLLSNRAVKPFAESYSKQKQFITDANHELKTPLAVIKASNEVIEMENGSSEWTQTIEKQVARLSKLTEKLVFLSRMDEENLQHEMNQFSLSETATEISAPFESLAVMQNKLFSCEIQQDVTMVGDNSLVGQLLNVLLDNAFKYCDEGGNIKLQVSTEGKNKKIVVSNTCSNVDTENLDKLFDRFYRSDKSRNSETGGFGIGLSVAKSIVNLHKGKIFAKYVEGNMIFIVIF